VPTPDDNPQPLAIAADSSYASLFDQGLGEIDLKDLLAKGDTVYINLPHGPLAENLALPLVKLVIGAISQMSEKQV
jgi:hypothetical protein